jgi:hypothetical protein
MSTCKSGFGTSCARNLTDGVPCLRSHNWTGNRVTVRDWFQLSLKEGLTVFRDQEFSADCGLRLVKRIHDVARLRASQFAEDSGYVLQPEFMSLMLRGIIRIPFVAQTELAPGPAVLLSASEQLLHHNGVRKRSGSGAHAPHSVG